MNYNILFFFSSTTVGGAETNIYKISKELVHRGYNVSWCYMEDTGPLTEKVDFILKDCVNVGLFYRSPLSFFKKYRNIIRNNKIDIVFNFGLRVELISRVLSKKLGARFIISNIRSTDDWRKCYHVWLDKLTQRFVDCWVSNSIAGKIITMEREGVLEENIKVIYNFFEVDCVQKGVEEEFEQFNRNRIGVLANITHEKGYFDLIEVSKLLTQRGIEHVFYYAGKDKTNGEFSKKILSQNLEKNFKYFGYINDKRAFFEKFDIFILPSYLEGMPTALMEAMYYGKYIIATNVGGVPEIISNKENGLLVSPGDYLEMASLIAEANDIDWKKFRMNSSLRLHEFEVNKIMSQWEDTIHRLSK